MRADPRFCGKDKAFWAHVRTLSQAIGYTERGKGSILTPTLEQIVRAMRQLTLSVDHLLDNRREAFVAYPSKYCQSLMDYFSYRADVLNNQVQGHLQTKEQAHAMFERLRATMVTPRAAAMNKQKGDKATVAYLTAMVNILVDANAQGMEWDSNPMQLTTITKDEMPLRTLARRVDGAFPSVINPVAIWEIKEYYHTTTFGSRVADGVYESLLDGLELEEMRLETGVDVKHVLIVDAHYTWWECGRSYLCRLIDLLHMGYADAVVFGTEIEQELPLLVREWVELVKARTATRSDGPRQHGQGALI